MASLLTQGQGTIWELRFKGFRAADISKRIGKSRQYVSKSLQSVDSKIYRGMMEAARMNKIMVKAMDPERGFLVGHSREFGSNVLLTFSPQDGINVWAPHRGQCEACLDLSSCRAHLLREVDRLGVSLSKAEEQLPPAELAGIVFTRAWPETREVFP
jgi:hypothetical protein